jgi:thiamine-phosphate pyrophosphorylase
MRLPHLLLLTDAGQLPAGRDLVGTVAACVSAGLEAVVVREHHLPSAERRELVAALAELPGLAVISSRTPDPAAHGVHLAVGQPPPEQGTWGRSCHNRDEVGRARGEGADYVTLSPYAASASKPGYGPPLDPTAYPGHAIPVYALGGIGTHNAAAARAAGADGIAVMGAVMRAADPAAEVAELLREVR